MFDKYIEAKFASLPPSYQSYKGQFLTELEQYKSKLIERGLKDQNVIYDLCIDRLGDVEQRIINQEDQKQRKLMLRTKIIRSIVITVCYFLALVGTYLAVSFTTKAWGKSWLIMVGGVFLVVCLACGLLINKCVKRKVYLPIRLLLIIIIALCFTFIFLMVLMLTSINYSWMLFLVMVIFMLSADTLLALITNSKSQLFDVLITIQVTCALCYVMLGVSKLLSWHPFWLINIFGVFINCLIITFTLKARYSQINVTEDGEVADE